MAPGASRDARRPNQDNREARLEPLLRRRGNRRRTPAPAHRAARSRTWTSAAPSARWSNWPRGSTATSSRCASGACSPSDRTRCVRWHRRCVPRTFRSSCSTLRGTADAPRVTRQLAGAWRLGNPTWCRRFCFMRTSWAGWPRWRRACGTWSRAFAWPSGAAAGVCAWIGGPKDWSSGTSASARRWPIFAHDWRPGRREVGGHPQRDRRVAMGWRAADFAVDARSAHRAAVDHVHRPAGSAKELGLAPRNCAAVAGALGGP